jgi:Spherulation-specific family 4
MTIYAHPVAGPVAVGVPLGYLDLAYGARPIDAVRAELDEWAGQAVGGIFFDQAPTSPFSIGPVAMAVRAARRLGFDTLLLNPGRPTDSLYRGLGATVCTFEGDWMSYQNGTVDGVRPGDGHVVHGVPGELLERCLDMMRGRGAGWGVATSAGCLVPSLVDA